MVVPGPKTGRSGKTYRAQLNVVVEVVVPLSRAGDGRLAQSIAPAATQPQAWARAMGDLIVRTRKRLQKAPAGLIGARAIRHELRQLMPRRAVPSATTIYRRLHQTALLAPQPQHATPYFPAPSEEVAGSLDALDWTCRYLEGGTKVYAFHTLNLRTRALPQTLARTKELGTAQAHVLAAWQNQGIPRFLQLDNDAIFCGGYKVERVVGQFTRLCLYVGVELIFLPFGNPNTIFKSNN